MPIQAGSSDWRELVTETPINNITEGGSVLMMLSVEGGSSIEIGAKPLFAEGNWAQPYICIFSGGPYGRLIDNAVIGGWVNDNRFGPAVARTRGFSRLVTVAAGERSLCLVMRAVGSADMLIYRRYPTVTCTLFEAYR